MNESFMNSTKSGLRRSEMQDGDEQTWFRNRVPQPLGEKQRWPPPSSGRMSSRKRKRHQLPPEIGENLSSSSPKVLVPFVQNLMEIHESRSVTNPVKEDKDIKVIDEGISKDEDRARVSRLFYLQLYSSVLSNENNKISNRPMSPLSKSPAEMNLQNDPQEVSKQSAITRSGKIPFPKLKLFKQSVDLDEASSIVCKDLESLPQDSHSRGNFSNPQNRTIPLQLNQVNNAPTQPVNPMASFKKKGFSNIVSPPLVFRPVEIPKPKFKAKGFHKSISKTSRCIAKSGVFKTFAISTLTLALLVILIIIVSSPESHTSFYEEIWTKDHDPSLGPRIALCLPVPFTQEKLRNFGISQKLASFLLYALSPFLPNQDILDNSEMISALTTEFKLLTARNSDLRRRSQLGKYGLKKLLRSLAPACSDIVVGCRTGSRAILKGEDCCKLLLKKSEYSSDGLCWSGELSKLSTEPVFPLSTPGSFSSFAFILNFANQPNLDHRIIPWDPVRSRTMLAVTLHPKEELAHRAAKLETTLRPGEVTIIDVFKRTLDNSEASMKMSRKCSESEDVTHYNRKGCRSSVIEMIAEKSLNCSLISLPQINTNLPVCGPLEGLALMYILREQGALVTSNTTLSNRFETTLLDHCPAECHLTFFESVVSKSSELDEETTEWLGSKNSPSSTIVEFRYKSEEYIKTRRFRSGFFILITRLGSISGLSSLVVIVFLGLKQVFGPRLKRSLF